MMCMDFLGFCATTATKQGAERWTLGLRGLGPHTEGFYMRWDRGLAEGVAGMHRGAQGRAQVKIGVQGEKF